MNIIFDVNESLAKLSNVLNSAKSMYIDTSRISYNDACNYKFEDIKDNIDIYISSKFYDLITYNFNLDYYNDTFKSCRNFIAIANNIKNKVSSVTIIYESFEIGRANFLKDFLKQIFIKVPKINFHHIKYLKDDASDKDLKAKIESKQLYRDFYYKNYNIIQDFVDKLKSSYNKDNSKIFDDAKAKNNRVSADYIEGRLSALYDVFHILEEFYIDIFDNKK